MGIIPRIRACGAGVARHPVAAAAIALLVQSDGAAAQISWQPPYRRDIETRGPTHGYSGFVRQGARTYYCDYMRIPNRTCTTDRAVRQRCRVASWTLQQRCY